MNNISTVNYGKDAYIFKCQETESGREFKMKLIETIEADKAILYFGGLNPILQEKGLPYRIQRHTEIELSQPLIDFLDKLVSGQICGLFHEGQEDQSIPIRILQSNSKT